MGDFPVGAMGLSDVFTRGEIVAFLMGALVPAVGFVLAAGRRQKDQTLLYYGGYMLTLLGAFMAQIIFGAGDEAGGAACWSCLVGNLVQLPYAWFYLRFVREYFGLGSWAPRALGLSRALEWAYLLPLPLLGLQYAAGFTASAWVILLLNLTNLLGSYVLGVWAWRKGRPGAGWFLAAVLPLALAGLLHGLQWAVNRGGSNINGLLPLWAGITAQLLIFLLALGVRYRRLVGRLGEEERARVAAEREAVRLAAINQTQEEYSTYLSHEVRTPLNGMLGFARLLQESRLDADQRDMVRTIQTSGRLMLGLVDSMLDLARIEAGVGSLRREAVDLRAMVHDVAELLGPQARWKQLELAVEVAPEVPEWVAADHLRVQQVLINLVANAVNHTQRGEVRIAVRPMAGGGVAIAVRDTGPGIPLLKQERLFQPFLRTRDGAPPRSPDDEPGGTGLGLVIARRLAGLMNSELVFESTPQVGSTFVLRLHAAAWTGPVTARLGTEGVAGGGRRA